MAQKEINEMLIGLSEVGYAAPGAELPVIIRDAMRYSPTNKITVSEDRDTEYHGGTGVYYAYSEISGVTVETEVMSESHPLVTKYMGYPSHEGGKGYDVPKEIKVPTVALGWVDEETIELPSAVGTKPKHATRWDVKVVLLATGTRGDRDSTDPAPKTKPDWNGKTATFEAEAVNGVYKKVFNCDSKQDAIMKLYTLFNVEVNVPINLGEGAEQPSYLDLLFNREYDRDNILGAIQNMVQDPTGQNRQVVGIISEITGEAIEQGVRLIPVLGSVIGPFVGQFAGNYIGNRVGEGLRIVWGDPQQQANNNNDINNNDINNNENENDNENH